MAKYLMLWEMDLAKVPIDPQERAKAWEPFVQAIKQDMENGIGKDWGAFVGELRGYTVVEGTEVEIEQMVNQYLPFVTFKTHPVVSLEQEAEVIKALSK